MFSSRNLAYIFIILFIANDFVWFIECGSSYVPPSDFCQKYLKYKMTSSESLSVKEQCNPKTKPPKVSIYCDPKGARAQDPKDASSAFRLTGEFHMDWDYDEFMKKYILDLHNSFRNIVACGKKWILNAKGDRFPKASSMYKLNWNEELVWSSFPPMRTCFWSHDTCIITPNFTWIGQNIATTPKPRRFEMPLKEHLREIVEDGWAYMFYEIFACEVKTIKSFDGPEPMNFPKMDDMINDALKTTVGQFVYERGCRPPSQNCWEKKMKTTGHALTALMSTTTQDKKYVRGKVMGCSGVYCKKPHTGYGYPDGFKYTYNYGCNYDDKYLFDRPIYVEGEPATKCNYGKKSKIFCCLCMDKDDHTEDHLTEEYCMNPLKATFPWPDTSSFLKTDAEKEKMKKEEAEAEQEWQQKYGSKGPPPPPPVGPPPPPPVPPPPPPTPPPVAGPSVEDLDKLKESQLPPAKVEEIKHDADVIIETGKFPPDYNPNIFDSPNVTVQELAEREKTFGIVSNQLREEVAEKWVANKNETRDFPKPPVEMNACRIDNLRQKENYVGTREAEEIPIDGSMQQFIVDKINLYRNHLACGEAKLVNVAGEQFPIAARMPKIQWNTELSTSARFFTSKCRHVRECGKTFSFPRVGHTMSILHVLPNDTRTTKNFIDQLIFTWFGEYVNILVKNIANYTDSCVNYNIRRSKHFEKLKEMKWKSNLLDTESFTQMMHDRAWHVGCGFYSCGTKKKKKHLFFTCKWSARKFIFGSIYDQNVTSGGKSCKQKSSKYCCLCLSPKEKEEKAAKCESSNQLTLPAFDGAGSFETIYLYYLGILALVCYNSLQYSYS